jgi:aspartate carbamoyltransferase catalytic subunit
VNAGDGAHQHPTQALLDAFTLTRALEMGNSLAGVRIAMVGDIRHSRVARSTVRAFVLLGAKVTLVAPASLLPPSLIYSDTTETRHEWPVSTSHDLDEVLGEVDVVYLLRMQHERMNAAFISSVGEYALHFGLTPQRLAKLPHSFKLMHPGPMNHGVEIGVDPAMVPGSLITQQVTNGVSVRMAVLLSLLGSAATSEMTKEEKNV